MKEKISKELEEAFKTILAWFHEKNQNLKKPLTMLDVEFDDGKKRLRLITHLSFYGRDEIIEEIEELK